MPTSTRRTSVASAQLLDGFGSSLGDHVNVVVVEVDTEARHSLHLRHELEALEYGDAVFALFLDARVCSDVRRHHDGRESVLQQWRQRALLDDLPSRGLDHPELETVADQLVAVHRQAVTAGQHTQQRLSAAARVGILVMPADVFRVGMQGYLAYTEYIETVFCQSASLVEAHDIQQSSEIHTGVTSTTQCASVREVRGLVLAKRCRHEPRWRNTRDATA